MILSDVRRYLRQNKQASLDELSTHFSVDPEALRGMLDHLIAKGSVSVEPVVQTEGAACGKSGGCGGCSSATTLCIASKSPEIFRWMDS